jgi:hypothetical protein
MADPVPPSSPTPAQPGMPQGAPGAASQGQPPIGSSPATQPVPNRGLQAAGLAKLGVVVKQLEGLLPVFGAGSDAGRDVLKALNSLSKHIQPGDVSQGVEQSALQELMTKLRQNAPQIAAARAAGQGGAPGGAAPQPGGAPGGGAIPPQILAMMQKPQGQA